MPYTQYQPYNAYSGAYGAYNPYPQFQNQYQPTQNMPMTQMSGANQPAPAPQPQGMTYPTIHADIVQTDDSGVIERWPVSQDKPQMFIDHAETVITVKSVSGNGVTLDYYDKRPPAPSTPPFNPSEYVRRDELPELIAAAVASQNVSLTSAKRQTKKDESEA